MIINNNAITPNPNNINAPKHHAIILIIKYMGQLLGTLLLLNLLLIEHIPLLELNVMEQRSLFVAKVKVVLIKEEQF